MAIIIPSITGSSSSSSNKTLDFATWQGLKDGERATGFRKLTDADKDRAATFEGQSRAKLAEICKSAPAVKASFARQLAEKADKGTLRAAEVESLFAAGWLTEGTYNDLILSAK